MFRDMDAEYCNVDIPIIVKDVFFEDLSTRFIMGLNLLLLSRGGHSMSN